MIKLINEENFQENVSEGIVLVKFYSDSCIPCKFILPILTEISSAFQNVKFTEIDALENPTITSKYNISSVPTIIIFKDGEPVKKLISPITKQKINEELNNILKEG